uniref:Rab-interacting lysosomal protein n=1 Tax=Pan troglodytes TaxID=9598 RepID=A0A2I3TDB3_PANTR
MEPRRAAPGAPGWGSREAAGSASAAELVYHLAGALGTELQDLARRFGPEAAAGLVPLVVRALELLEQAAVGPAPDSLQVSAQQAEQELRRLREENERLRRELRAGPQEERALLRQLKEVTDRQRDELRAHNRDLRQRGQETEALQEQLQRLLLVNAELRHKLAAVQTQLRAAQGRERERQQPGEAATPQAKERARGQAGRPGHQHGQEPEWATAGAGAPGNPEDPAEAAQQLGGPSEAGQCRFSREEFEQILQERNELKAKVFLLKEELAYFQRELLTDHRVPGLLLEAMKVAVRKQRKKIKAKMLGTPEEAESSEDEAGPWILLSDDKGDHPPPPESKIQSFFGLWYRGKAESSEDETSSPAPSKLGGEEEAQPQSPAPDPPCSALHEHLCLGASAAPEA